MHPKIIASSIQDLAVGMRVRHYGCHDSGTKGVITALNPHMSSGGEVQVLTDERAADGSTNGRGFYFDGFTDRASRKWEILAPRPVDPTEVGVGDEIEIVTTVKGVVKRVTNSTGTPRITIEGAPYSSYALLERPHSDTPSTRTWAVTKKAAPPPPPWQGGDMARSALYAALRVRQADGKWLDTHGRDSGMSDSDIENVNVAVVLVRGGVRQS